MEINICMQYIGKKENTNEKHFTVTIMKIVK